MDQPAVDALGQTRRAGVLRGVLGERTPVVILRQPPVHARQVCHPQIGIHPHRPRVDDRQPAGLLLQQLKRGQQGVGYHRPGLTMLQLHVQHQPHFFQVDPFQDLQETIHLLQGRFSRVKHVVRQHASAHRLRLRKKVPEHRVAIAPRDASPDRDEVHHRVVGRNLIKIRRLA